MRRAIPRIVRFGMFLGLGLIVLGLVLYASSGEGLSLTSGTPVHLHELPGSLRSFAPVAVLLVGFLVLLATPITRVLASLIEFESIHDRPFVMITGFVLVLLCVSIVVGILA
ncbi:MAG: DUF1634 domain-containing protein [Thermoplasmata archaeon]